MRLLNKLFRRAVFIVFAALSAALYLTPVSGYGTIGTSGAAFLELGTGARALSMGEAYTAASEDVNLLYFNPAGLGTLPYPVASVGHQELLYDSRYENVIGAFPLYKGFLGVSASAFWVPPFDKVDIEGNETGRRSSSTRRLLSAMVVTWGRCISAAL